jgi:hypothetical protein
MAENALVRDLLTPKLQEVRTSVGKAVSAG